MTRPGERTLHDIRDGAAAVRRIARLYPVIAASARDHRNVGRIMVFGCGSSYWAGEIAAEWLREAGRAATAHDSADIITGNAIPGPGSLAIALSQSGRTSETIKAARIAKEGGSRLMAVVNPARSPLGRLADQAIVLDAGKESVVATKTFDATLAALFLFARALSGRRGGIAALPALYGRIESVDLSSSLRLLAAGDRAYALGLDADHGLAGEASVKFAEAADLQVTPLPATEASHGPKANMSSTPVLMFATETKRRTLYRRIARELTGAGALVIIIGNIAPVRGALHITIPGRPDLHPFLAAKLIHYLAWGLGLAKGLDPDRPRTLKKYVIRKGF